MRIREINEFIESLAPLSLQADYDNSGFILGCADDEVTGILTTLDLTCGAVDEAAAVGANLIITHHPPIFAPIRRITEERGAPNALLRAAQRGMNVYSSHTCFDNAEGGLNDMLCADVGYLNKERLYPDGSGRLLLVKPESVASIASRLAAATGDRSMRIAGSGNISRIAVINGAGGRDDALPSLLAEKRAELLVTGEVKHSVALALREMGIALIEIGHYHSEKRFAAAVADVLAKVTRLNVVVYNKDDPYNG